MTEKTLKKNTTTMAEIEQISEWIETTFDQQEDPIIDNEQLSNKLSQLTTILDDPNPQLVADTAKALADAAKYETVREILRNCATVAKAVNLLATADDDALKINAMRLFGNLCFENDQARQEVYVNNGVKHLLSVLKNGSSDEARRIACGCIGNLVAGNDQLSYALYETGGTDLLLDLINNEENVHVRAFALKAINNIMDHKINRDKIIKVGLDILLELSKNGIDDDKAGVVEFITVLITMLDYDESKPVFVEKGGLDLYVKLFEKCEVDVDLVQKITDILTIFSDDENYRDRFLDNDLVALLKSYITRTDLDMVIRHGSISMLARLSGSNKIGDLLYEDLDFFVNVMQNEYKELAAQSAATIGNLVHNATRCSEIVQSGVAKVLVDIVSDEDSDMRLKHYLMIVIKNIAIGKDHKQFLLENGIIECCISLLQYKMNQILVHACLQVLRNFFTDDSKYVKIFFDNSGMDDLLPLLTYTESDHLLYESSRVIAIIATYPEYAEQLTSSGAYIGLVNLIKSPHHAVLVEEGIVGIQTIKEAGGDLSVFESLEEDCKNVPFEELQKKALAILN
eukprot:TRINITY_DN688_c0_g1_i1.p1 TRINITY_DN688_c0_g1~~TRINITY_DN688_c0_g1_i1.p1  ORF type:complete len:570 (+),score=141.36 TRINITY_DN688_c0_g1_i1:172-1881(+)